MEVQAQPEVKLPKVAIVVLNWNGWQDTIECLESLYQITYPNYNIIVVDNGSADESIEKIREYCRGSLVPNSKYIKYDPDNKPINVIEYTREDAEDSGITERCIGDISSNRTLVLIKNEKNYGFAKGNNIGFNFAINKGAKYIMTLNNDTVVARDFLDILVNLLEGDSGIGIAGPKCYYYDHPDTVQGGGCKINWWTGRINAIKSDKIIDVDSVSGCAMIIRGKLMKAISLFDTRFPFGNEDYEFCTRAIRNHYKVVYVPSSNVLHKQFKSRKELMKNESERKALLGNTGDLRLKDTFRLFKICAPTKINYLSMIIFYSISFIFLFPRDVYKYYKNFGFESSLLKAKSIIRELLYLAKK